MPEPDPAQMSHLEVTGSSRLSSRCRTQESSASQEKARSRSFSDRVEGSVLCSLEFSTSFLGLHGVVSAGFFFWGGGGRAILFGVDWRSRGVSMIASRELHSPTFQRNAWVNSSRQTGHVECLRNLKRMQEKKNHIGNEFSGKSGMELLWYSNKCRKWAC